MKTVAGRIEMIIQLMESGMLCKCKRMEFKGADYNNEPIYGIKHNKKCKAHKKVAELLNED